MIDLQVERQRKAFARVRESIETTQRAMNAGFDQLLESIEDLASVVSVPSKAENGSPVPQLVDVLRAAEILGVNRATIFNYVSNGDLQYVELPSGRGDRGIKRFAISDLKAFQERCSRVAS